GGFEWADDRRGTAPASRGGRSPRDAGPDRGPPGPAQEHESTRIRKHEKEENECPRISSAAHLVLQAPARADRTICGRVRYRAGSGTRRNSRRVDTEVLANLQLHPVDFGEETRCRCAVARRIRLGPAQVGDLGLETTDPLLRDL